MRLTAFTDYGLRVLMRMAGEPDRSFSTAELAVEFDLSRHHLLKIIGALAKGGVVTTQRGGGALLARRPSDIRLGDIVVILEDGQGIVQCFAIQLHPVDQKKLRTTLLEGRADFAFAAPPPDDPRIETSVFREEELLLIRAPEVKAKIAVFNQLPEAMQSVLFVAYDRLHALIDMWTEANSLSLDRAIESLTAPDLRGPRNFVVKGFGWSAPPRDLVAAELLSGALEAMSPPHRNPVIAYHLLRLKSSMRTPEQRGRCRRVSRISGHRRRCSRRRLAASPAARRNGLRAEGRRRKY